MYTKEIVFKCFQMFADKINPGDDKVDSLTVCKLVTVSFLNYKTHTTSSTLPSYYSK